MSDLSIGNITSSELRDLQKPEFQVVKPPQNDSEKAGTSFTTMLKSAVQEVNNLQLEADAATKNLALGKSTDIHGTLIAMEKANISFQLLMEVRSKIIGAYKEVMRMNV